MPNNPQTNQQKPKPVSPQRIRLAALEMARVMIGLNDKEAALAAAKIALDVSFARELGKTAEKAKEEKA